MKRERGHSAARMQSQIDNRQHTEAQALEDRIWESQKVRCKVTADADLITIRANSYSDYVLAKAAINANSIVGSRKIIQG